MSQHGFTFQKNASSFILCHNGKEVEISMAGHDLLQRLFRGPSAFTEEEISDHLPHLRQALQGLAMNKFGIVCGPKGYVLRDFRPSR